MEGRQTSGLGRHGRYVLWLIHVAATAREAGAAAERAAELKISKYSGLEDKCVFQPIAVAVKSLVFEGRRISAQSGDERERQCLPVPKVIIMIYYTIR